MSVEASDIVKLLELLAQEGGDATCHQLATHARRGNLSILEICHEAIRSLATEKAHFHKAALDSLALRAPSITISNDDPLVINLNASEREAGAAEMLREAIALDMRERARLSCHELADEYRKAAEHHLKERNAEKAAQAIAWADGAMNAGRGVASLPLRPEGEAEIQGGES